jgi:ankyrin repeat protein
VVRKPWSIDAEKNASQGGLTPLLCAAREGCVECVKHLLKGGAKIDLPDPDGRTPLLLALIHRHFDLAAVLIFAGADVNRCDLYGRAPLYVAIETSTAGRRHLPLMETTELQVAEMLLLAGANPNTQLTVRPPCRQRVLDRRGEEVVTTGATPLLLAANAGAAEAVELLLEHDVLVDLPNSRGVTPLMAAAGMGYGLNTTRGRKRVDEDAVTCVKLIQQAGCAVNARALNGMTALHSAAAQGWDETVKVLVAGGADLEAEDALGMMPMDHAGGRQSGEKRADTGSLPSIRRGRQAGRAERQRELSTRPGAGRYR